MNASEYAVRIVEYDTGKGKQMVIKFGNDYRQRVENSSYYRTFGKGNRLYFLPSAPSNGVKLTDNYTLTFCKEDMIESLRKYAGEYANMRYDEGLHYEYIDLEDKAEAEVNAGARRGVPKTSTYSGTGRQKKTYEEDTMNKEINTIAEEKKADTEPSVKDTMTQMIIEYVLSEKFNEALVLAKVLERLGLT